MRSRFFLAFFLCYAAMASADQARNAQSLRIGLVDTLFRDVAEADVSSSVQQFKDMMRKETGLKGESVHYDSVQKLSDDLANGTQDLGVFHGYEFGWAREKNPKLIPLAVAVNQQMEPWAELLVRADSKAKTFADLKGLTLALPKQSKGHCCLFLDRACGKTNTTQTEFFGKITASETIEDALDDLVDGVVDAALVDGIGAERYKARKPKRMEKLKELERSVLFPSPVLVYQDGKMDEATRRKVLDGLLNAAKHAEGKQMLTVWKLSNFERVPKDYDKRVDEVLKVYPAPK